MANAGTSSHALEVSEGQRFQFGANWRSFLGTLDDDRIRVAEESLRGMLGVRDLTGKTFLDVGSGSGLFSLAARRLGARVHSLDFDRQSVECARYLKSRWFAEDPAWTIEEASILDEAHVAKLGLHDVVYSWGVLHHTGEMWKAMEHVSRLVAPGGQLFIALYNKIPRRAKRWLAIKKLYNRNFVTKHALLWPYVSYQTFSNLVYGLRRHGDPLRPFREFKKKRGMSMWHDWVDWIGGLPYETARVDEVFRFYKERGFALENVTTTHGLANNQFVFRRQS